MDIDEKTMADIVGLIEAEMRADPSTQSAHRLASVVAGRLGYETPKKTCLSVASKGKWEIEVFSRSVALRAPSGFICMPIHGPDTIDTPEDMPTAEVLANAKLMAGSKEIAELACDMVIAFFHDDDCRSMSDLHSRMCKLSDLLKEAGCAI